VKVEDWSDAFISQRTQKMPTKSSEVKREALNRFSLIAQ
jgi:hypothetical protein